MLVKDKPLKCSFCINRPEYVRTIGREHQIYYCAEHAKKYQIGILVNEGKIKSN